MAVNCDRKERSYTMNDNGVGMNLKQNFLIIALRHSIRHYRWAARLYQALAANDNNAHSRTTLLTLSQSADLQAHIAIAALTLLHQPTPKDRDSMPGNFWAWILLKCKLAVILAWLGW